MTSLSVVSVAQSNDRGIAKASCTSVALLADHGVVGDIHGGQTIRHLARMLKDASQPNLRQVHLLGSNLYAELTKNGHKLDYGRLGENMTLEEIDVTDFRVGSVLSSQSGARIAITGLRRPCKAIESLGSGLLHHCVGRTADGGAFMKHGLMGVVLTSGSIRVGEELELTAPAEVGPLSLTVV